MKRTTAQAITLIATLLFLSLEAVSQQPASSPRPDEPSTGSITGRVVSDTGQPLAGATIFLRGTSALAAPRTTISDLEGNFQLHNLDAALYFLSANSPAYTSEVTDPDGQPIYYRIGDTVRLELTRGGVVTGTVSNSVGEPLVSVRVRAQMIRDAKGQRMTPPGFIERTTDDRGIYRLYGLTPGTYLVLSGGSSFQSFQNGPYDLDAPTYAPSSTRDNATEIVVRAGEETNVDIRYRGEPGRRVSGTISNLGTQGASVNLSVAGTGLAPAHTSFVEGEARGFAFYGIPDGDYDVMAQQSVPSSPGVVADVMLSAPRRISVRGADVSGIELTTQPLASISGAFTLETSKARECENKRRPIFSETVVDLVRNIKDQRDEQSPVLRSFAGVGQPDKSGTFSIRNIRNGQYLFSPKFFARYWYLQSVSLPGQSKTPPAKTTTAPPRIDASRNWLALKSGDRITGLTITLAEGAASIRGQIAVPEGEKPAPNLSVFVVPAEREKLDDVLRFTATPTATDGTFLLTNLAPGRYWIVAQPDSDPELAPGKIRLPNAAESRTKLRRTAEAAKVEVELKPCQNLTEYKLSLKP